VYRLADPGARGPAQAAAPACVDVLGVRFDALDMRTLLRRLEHDVERGERFTVAFANPEFVMEVDRTPFLADYLRATRYTLADGTGVVWAARRAGRPLPERVTGTDFVPAIASLCARRGWGLFLLGGRPGVARAAQARLEAAAPGLRVVGALDGYFDDDGPVVAAINAARPTFLMVCLGNPRQEAWIARHFDRLDVQVAFGNGGALDFCSGRVPRAPRWMIRCSLEWLHRLWCDLGWRRLRRQARLGVFVLRVLASVRRPGPRG
jgi:N-acetylglucosaminyldiphosphoundecaprenol N-acetyl-beta-D-mannosaminyltransferase